MTIYLKNREINFFKICSHFEHEKISGLVSCAKINKKLFNQLSQSVKEYVDKSRLYKFENKTPNGLLVPKKEIEKEFNDVLISYRDVLLSLNFDKIISLWTIPVVRIKDPEIDDENKNRVMRSELPHSDTWVGWNKKSILVNIPILGDTDKNKVQFYQHPTSFNESWVEKQISFEEGAKKFAKLCKPIKSDYKKGYAYIADISVIHQTHRSIGSSERISLEIPLFTQLPNKNEFGANDTIDHKTIMSLNKEYEIKFSLKMHERVGQSGISRPVKFFISKINA